MTRDSIEKLVEILMVEDNAGDIRLMREALKCQRRLNIHVVKDGIQALRYLHREREFKDAPRPDLILLDLDLPTKDGREVLAEIKEDDKLKCIPVVVLTTSDAPEDVLSVYERHANCYIRKPIDLEKFDAIIGAIGLFWLSTVVLPPSN